MIEALLGDNAGHLRRHVTYAKSLFLLKHASVKIVMCRAERGSRAGEEFT